MGKILIPGFYDEVEQPSADELKAWKACPSTRRSIARRRWGRRC